MLLTYTKIALRLLRKQLSFTIINVVGLSIGLTCCIMIGMFVLHERSFDSFHSKGDRIYRINKRVTPQGGGVEYHAITGGAMGPALSAGYADIEQSVRILPWFDPILMQYGDVNAKVSEVVFADSNLFSVFDFELLRGSRGQVLVEPMSIVLSENTARRLFGDNDPIGQVLLGLNELPFTVTGIVEDAPAQSHLTYQAFISWESTLPGEGGLNFGWLNNWITQVTYTYLLLSPGANPEALERQIAVQLQERLPQFAERYQHYLQPLSEIYLDSADLLYTRGISLGNGMYVMLFTLVGLLILVIACVNFMNLTTARFSRRFKEVGMRKVLGANKHQLRKQFLAESMVMTGIALLLSVLMVVLLLPAFNGLTSRTLSFNLFENPWVIAGILGLTTLTGLMAGGYPAELLSRVRPLRALKKYGSNSIKGFSLRRVLVVFQFSISIALIVGTLVIVRQVGFIQGQDPGFERDQVIVLPLTSNAMRGQFRPFKQSILQHPSITHAAGSNSVPGTREGMSSFSLTAEGKAPEEDWQAYVWRVDDFDLLDTYGIVLAEGRYFSEQFLADTARGVVINQSMARALNWTDPIGKRLVIDGETEETRVIGVLEDFHYESLHHVIEPLVIQYAPRYENLSVRVQRGQLEEVVSYIRAQWEFFEDAYPFEYLFLDEATTSQYEAEQLLMHTLSIFSGLAIFIACIGLFGLAAFSAQQRTKEIGIRKVVGASTTNLIQLLTRDFMLLVGIAFLLSTPMSFLIMQRWLEGFAYRIDLSWWMFALAGILAIGVALLTVSYHSVKVALSDPIVALKHE